MSFKFLAIRPLKGCSSRFLKNLDEDEIYKFYNDYEFILDKKKNEVEKIMFNSSVPESFFNVDRYKVYSINEKKNIPISINISAIVGENGSGKSALSELFIASLFIISRKLEFVEKDKFINIKNPTELDNEESIRYDSDLKDVIEGISVETYFLMNEIVYKLRIDSNRISYQQSVLEDDFFVFNNEISEVNNKEELPSFFYSIVVNYSFYAFNSNDIGMWIKAFFHKNDGYQMPIVINPYRNMGIMDINTENYLTRSRVLANVLSIDDYKNINSKSEIKEIELSFDSRKNYKFLEDGLEMFTDEFVRNFKVAIISPLYNKMFNSEYPINLSEEQMHAERYLIQKLITIPTRYTNFSQFNKRKTELPSQNNFDIEGVDASEYIIKLYEDRSHITTKVRQTLNYLHEDIFEIKFNTEIKINIEETVAAMKRNVEKELFTEMIDYLPPPFLFSKIKFEDQSYFHHLSSGEKQKIYSLNSIIYHLKNIDSVNKNKKKNKDKNIISYDTINLLFDEIELYYHPDFQKKIVSEILDFIQKAKYEYINAINILFLTHSPFILSDIPNQNILYLKKGKSLKGDDRPKKSFGANITDLLADSFFIHDGLMGDFAKNKIQEVINWLNKNDRNLLVKEEIKIIIEMIDEPILKRKLSEMYSNIVGENLELEIIEKEIRLLQERRNKIQNK